MKKKYRIIYNHDGQTLVSPFDPFFELPFTVENFIAKTIGHLANTHVDAVTWTLGTDNGRLAAEQGPGRASNMYCHETDVGERFYELKPPFKSKFWWIHAQQVKKMIEEGNDPPKVVVESGHKQNLDVFIGFRMNDLHDSRLLARACRGLMWSNMPMRFPVYQEGKFIEENIVGYICKMKREHPELLIGEHDEISQGYSIGFDYAHKAVRDFRLALIKEACEKYDLDGIELDFMRTFIFFKPGEEKANMALMTEFMSKVREILDQIGRTRNKQLKLLIKTLAPLEVSKEIGLDIQSWLKQGWIDALILGIDDRSNIPIKEDVKTAHKNNCPVYASIKADAYQRKGATPEIFRAIAANHYRVGVDGIHMFNMGDLRDSMGFNPPGYGLGPDYDFQPLREIGSIEQIKLKDKHYVLDNLGTAEHANGANGFLFYEWPESVQDFFLKHEFGTKLARTELPARLEENRSATIIFGFADDLKVASVKNLGMKVTLKVSFRDLTGGDHLIAIKLNGSPLPTFVLTDKYPISYVRELPVDPVLFRVGDNKITFSVKRQNPNVISELWIEDVEILVNYR